VSILVTLQGRHFVRRSFARGWAEIEHQRGRLVAALGVLAAIGVLIGVNVTVEVPAWVNAVAVLAPVVLVPLEGAFLEWRDVAPDPAAKRIPPNRENLIRAVRALARAALSSLHEYDWMLNGPTNEDRSRLWAASDAFTAAFHALEDEESIAGAEFRALIGYRWTIDGLTRIARPVSLDFKPLSEDEYIERTHRVMDAEMRILRDIDSGDAVTLWPEIPTKTGAVAT
jgi:hypothetical protein